MNLDEIKEKIIPHRGELRSRFHVKQIMIFGSYVWGENRAGSDIDVLVDFNKPIGFFEFMDLEEYLENLFHVKIDLVTRKALKPRIGASILKEAVAV